MTAVERDRQVHRAYRVINAQLENPTTGRKMNAATKRKLFLFFYYLSEIQQKDNYSYFAEKYNKVIQVQKGDIRKSWQMVADAMSIKFEKVVCARTCMRMVNILAELGLLQIEHEELSGKKVYAGMQSLKVIRLRTWSELEEFEAEMAVEDLIRNVNKIILAHTEPEMLEIYAENEVSANLDGGEKVFVTQSDSLVCITSNESVLVGQKLIAPAEGENWRVKVCEGRVSADRKLLPRDEVPEEYDGEYYATWVGEKADMFYTPWVVWDIDNEKYPEQALADCRAFVANLLDYVSPDALRVVFSTRKGFHVYLDSRCVALRPSESLHEDLKRFCEKLLPICDKSLYSRNRIIGVPNSRHRETGLYYIPISTDELFECSLADLRAAARNPQEFADREDEMPVSEHLAKIYNEKPAVQHSGFSGLETIKQTMLQGHPSFRGVGKGERDGKMFELSVYYKRLGLGIEEVTVLVLAANDRNEPPLPRETIRKKVNSAFAREGVTIV